MVKRNYRGFEEFIIIKEDCYISKMTKSLKGRIIDKEYSLALPNEENILKIKNKYTNKNNRVYN